MKYTTKALLKDGAMSQLQYAASFYEQELITARECIEQSNLILYNFLDSLDETDLHYEDIIGQHRANFNRYEDWVTERLVENE